MFRFLDRILPSRHSRPRRPEKIRSFRPSLEVLEERRVPANYTVTMLTDNNPTLAYGITTIENVATVINRDLNLTHNGAIVPATRTAPPEAADELVPDLPGVP